MFKKKHVSTFLILFFLIFQISCSEEEELELEKVCEDIPNLKTNAPTEITKNTAIFSGFIAPPDCNKSIVSQGFVFGLETLPEIEDANKVKAIGCENECDSITSVKKVITDLQENSKYYYRTYLVNSVSTYYGNQKSFTTDIGETESSQGSVSNITAISADISNEISSDGGAEITLRGVCWDIDVNPTIENDTTEDGSGLGVFESKLENLTANTTYYVRSYAVNEAGVTYGEEVSFTTKDGVAVIATLDVSSVGVFSSISGGDISDNGGALITGRGVCWSKDTNPTIENAVTEDGSGLGIFESKLENLTANTTYYVRSYAVNEAGVTYGEEVSFTTQDGNGTITTSEVTSIGVFTAISGGDISDNGGALVTGRGVCWSKDTNPTIENAITEDGSGLGVFESKLENLTANTTYYVRSYAINEVGVTYGEEVSFTTKDGIGTIATSEVTSIGAFTAQLGGDISDDGGVSVTQRGICWSKNSTPTIADGKTVQGQGTGVFKTELTGLKTSTKYYVRAYAVNEIGVFYGEVLSFTTQSGIAMVTTSQVSSIAALTALSGGNVSDDGGLPITAKGICWSKNTDPTINDFKTSNGQGLGAFDAELIDLEPNTTYYARSYAVNEMGVVYGLLISFSTLDGVVQLSTKPVFQEGATTLLTGAYISTNGGSLIESKGVCWATVPNPTITDNSTQNGQGSGTFTSELTGLQSGVDYYVRSYATNQLGTFYGDEVVFTKQYPMYLADNGVTIKARSWAVIGDISLINGKSYELVNTYELSRMASRGDDMTTICTSKVTSMDGLFNGNETFNQDIGSWDVSNVSNMRIMFQNATSFNQDLNYWDVGKVTDMRWLFNGATSFNGNISNWDVGNVTRMNIMFQNAKAFNQNLNKWDVSKVTSMQWMFGGASAFNGDVSNWDVGKVTDMKFMFSQAINFNQNLENWNVAAVTTMEGMFFNAKVFNSSISKWNVRNVKTMNLMLLEASSFSSENYTAFLNGIMSRAQWYDPQGVVLYASSKYCNSTARSYLINTFNWTIYDSGRSYSCN